MYWVYSHLVKIFLCAPGGKKREIEQNKMMQQLNKHLLLLIIMCMTGTALAQISSPRQKISINDNWRFYPGDVSLSQLPEKNAAEWQRIVLPHTWNRDDAFVKEKSYHRGVGWYRKSLAVDSNFRSKRLFLYFEAANQVADVYLNGKKLGRHIGGYSAFAFDITDAVHIDQPNRLILRVDNRHDENIPPLNADFTFYGGIYRDAWLIVTDPLHIDLLDHASPGIFISTPEISARSSRVRIRGSLVNDSKERHKTIILHRLIDPQGQEITRIKEAMEIEPESRMNFDQVSEIIKSPRLWSPSDPALYRVITEVRMDEQLLDLVENPLGFRWFSVDGQKGFSLNGKSLKLYGTNRHQDLPGYGNALPDWAHRRDVQIIKDDGFNFLRLAHYPQDPAVLEEADRLGLIIWEETPVVNLISMSEAFAGNCEQMLVEMIRQHYNHPSVVMWGYMNEIMLRKPDPVPDGYYEKLLALNQRLEARVRQEDPSRLTVTAQSNEEVFNGKGVSEIADILGMNLYFGWYYQDFAALGTLLDDLNRRYPQRPLMVSEYGAGSDERVHAREAKSFDFSSEYQQQYHEENFRLIRERNYMVGSAIWNQFDFGSGHRQDTKNAINQKGIYYYDRTPKDIAYFYRAQLSDKPVLHIAARDFRYRAGSRPADAQFPIPVYSNLPEIQLLLNGESLGTKRTDNRTARWKVILEHGKNHLLARGERDGGTVQDTFSVYYTDRQSFFSTADSDVNNIAVNAGAHYQFIDDREIVWEADHAYQSNGWGFSDGQPKRTHHRIYGSKNDPLFQSAQEGVSQYRFDVPDGRYLVEIGMAEILSREPGERIFSLAVNGQKLYDAIDLAADYGPFQAVRRSVDVFVNQGQGIRIELEKIIGEPLINAIRIKRVQR